MVAVTDRQHVGRAVADADAGLRRRDLHDVLRVVGHRVVHRLVGRRDAERGAVVVGAVVQAGAATGRRVHRGGDGGGAVRAEHRLRHLDLHLEPQRPRREPVRLLEPVAEQHHRADLVDRGDLRQRDDETGGQPPAEGAEHQVERPDAAAPGRGLHRLDPDPAHQRCGRAGERGQHLAGVGGVLVLLVVGPVAVAVLEVGPQVLDRLPRELGQHPRPDLRDQRRAEPGHGGHRRRVVARDRGQRLGPDPVDHVGAEPVGGEVERVHGLRRDRLPRPAGGQRGVPGREQVVQLAEHAVGQRHAVVSQRSRSATRPSSVGVPHSRSRAIPPSG